MEEYQQRVIAEKADLDGKISRLDSFIRSNLTAIPLKEHSRLVRQLELMRQYSEVLGERIAVAFK